MPLRCSPNIAAAIITARLTRWCHQSTSFGLAAEQKRLHNGRIVRFMLEPVNSSNLSPLIADSFDGDQNDESEVTGGVMLPVFRRSRERWPNGRGGGTL